jgi:hypothetical protein
MQKLTVSVLGLIVVFALGSAAIVSGQDSDEEMCVPLGDIVLEPPTGIGGTKKIGGGISAFHPPYS